MRNLTIKPGTRTQSKSVILKQAATHRIVKTRDVVRWLGISRQTAAQHLRELVAAGQLVKMGSTKSSAYALPHAAHRADPSRAGNFGARYALRGLSEDKVFQEIDLRIGLRKRLSPAAYGVIAYAFTEMLNNAIDHSRSAAAEIRVVLTGGKDVRNIRGTRVRFTLKQKSRKDLKKLFDEYSGVDYEFDKTRIVIHLAQGREEHISRSQAKRLLFGLEKFKRIVLDFKKAEGIGQGFADEIFRVFRNAHPTIQIQPVNMSPSVEFMVRRTA